MLERNQIKVQADIRISAAAFIPQYDILVCISSTGGEFIFIRPTDIAHPISTDIRTKQIGTFHIIFSQRSHILITAGNDIRIWNFECKIPHKSMISIKPEFKITLRKKLSDSFEIDFINPPCFDYEWERLYLPKESGFVSYDLDGKPIRSVSKLPTSARTSCAYNLEKHLFVTADPIEGVCEWSSHGSLARRHTIGNTSVLAVRFVTNEFILYLDTKLNIYLLDLYTSRLFHCVQLRESPMSIVFHNYPCPSILVSIGTRIEAYNIIIPWELWIINMIKPKCIRWCPRFNHAARVLVQTENSYIQLISPKTQKTITNASTSSALKLKTAYYDRGYSVSNKLAIANPTPRDQLFLVQMDGVVEIFGTGKTPCEPILQVELNSASVFQVQYLGELSYCIVTQTGEVIICDYNSFKNIKRFIVASAPVICSHYDTNFGTIIIMFKEELLRFDINNGVIMQRIPFIGGTISECKDDVLLVGYPNGKLSIIYIGEETMDVLDNQECNYHSDAITGLTFGHGYFISVSLDMTLKVWALNGSNISTIFLPLPLYGVEVINGKRDILVGTENEIMIIDGTLIFDEKFEPRIDAIDNYNEKWDELCDDVITPLLAQEEEKKMLLVRRQLDEQAAAAVGANIGYKTNQVPNWKSSGGGRRRHRVDSNGIMLEEYDEEYEEDGMDMNGNVQWKKVSGGSNQNKNIDDKERERIIREMQNITESGAIAEEEKMKQLAEQERLLKERLDLQLKIANGECDEDGNPIVKKMRKKKKGPNGEDLDEYEEEEYEYEVEEDGTRVKKSRRKNKAQEGQKEKEGDSDDSAEAKKKASENNKSTNQKPATPVNAPVVAPPPQKRTPAPPSFLTRQTKQPPPPPPPPEPKKKAKSTKKSGSVSPRRKTKAGIVNIKFQGTKGKKGGKNRSPSVQVPAQPPPPAYVNRPRQLRKIPGQNTQSQIDNMNREESSDENDEFYNNIKLDNREMIIGEDGQIYVYMGDGYYKGPNGELFKLNDKGELISSTGTVLRVFKKVDKPNVFWVERKAEVVFRPAGFDGAWISSDQKIYKPTGQGNWISSDGSTWDGPGATQGRFMGLPPQESIPIPQEDEDEYEYEYSEDDERDNEDNILLSKDYLSKIAKSQVYIDPMKPIEVKRGANEEPTILMKVTSFTNLLKNKRGTRSTAFLMVDNSKPSKKDPPTAQRTRIKKKRWRKKARKPKNGDPSAPEMNEEEQDPNDPDYNPSLFPYKSCKGIYTRRMNRPPKLQPGDPNFKFAEDPDDEEFNPSSGNIFGNAASYQRDQIENKKPSKFKARHLQWIDAAGVVYFQVDREKNEWVSTDGTIYQPSPDGLGFVARDGTIWPGPTSNANIGANGEIFKKVEDKEDEWYGPGGKIYKLDKPTGKWVSSDGTKWNGPMSTAGHWVTDNGRVIDIKGGRWISSDNTVFIPTKNGWVDSRAREYHRVGDILVNDDGEVWQGMAPSTGKWVEPDGRVFAPIDEEHWIGPNQMVYSKKNGLFVAPNGDVWKGPINHNIYDLQPRFDLRNYLPNFNRNAYYDPRTRTFIERPRPKTPTYRLPYAFNATLFRFRRKIRVKTPPLRRPKRIFKMPEPNIVVDQEAVVKLYIKGELSVLPLLQRLGKDKSNRIANDFLSGGYTYNDIPSPPGSPRLNSPPPFHPEPTIEIPTFKELEKSPPTNEYDSDIFADTSVKPLSSAPRPLVYSTQHSRRDYWRSVLDNMDMPKIPIPRLQIGEERHVGTARDEKRLNTANSVRPPNSLRLRYSSRTKPKQFNEKDLENPLLIHRLLKPKVIVPRVILRK